jgi:cytidylate kinase
MCPQKRVVLALYGLSCTGKTTVAEKIAELTGWSLRSAAKAVHERAAELGISPDALSLSEHRAIDETTRNLAASACETLVIEGTFLDALLSEVPRISRIELNCGGQERLRRFQCRENNRDLVSRDNADRQLRRSLHGTRRGVPDLSIDTTTKSPDDVAKEIIAWLGTNEANPKLD